jgi:hypothetical protein
MRNYIKKHFIVAIILFATLAFNSHLHGVWSRQVHFLVFLPVFYIADWLLPAQATWQHGGPIHILGEIVIPVLGFLWVWLIVYIVARVWAYIRKRQHDT